MGLIAFVLALLIVPDERGDQRQRFDWLGFLLLGPALFCLLWVTEALARPEVAWGEAALLGLGGAVLLALGVRYLRRAAAPMIDLASLRVPTFAVTIWGGSLFRMGVSAVPFLVPLMFQLGFGFDAFQSGMVLMAVFAGNLAMKPLTTPILRRFGFRPVLLVNGMLNVAAIAACAAFTPGTSLAAICIVLFLGGMTRSMQFTALNTIAFADIPQPAMSAANTLFSTAFQLAMGLGVGLGAIALRLGERLAGTAGLRRVRVAFLFVALVSLLGLLDSLRPWRTGRERRQGDAQLGFAVAARWATQGITAGRQAPISAWSVVLRTARNRDG